MAALVFGNAKYIDGGVLKNPANDAVDIATKLKGYGFHTIIVKDATVRAVHSINVTGSLGTETGPPGTGHSQRPQWVNTGRGGHARPLPQVHIAREVP